MIATLSGSKTPGGVQSLQIALFEYFSNKDIACKLFDIENGYVSSELNRKNIDYQLIILDHRRSKKDYSKYLDENDLLILFNGNLFENMLLFGKSEAKVLFWEVDNDWLHRFIYTKYYPIKGWAVKQELNLLTLLTKKAAMFFIDDAGKEVVQSRLNSMIPKSQYLPIPVQIDPRKEYIKSKNQFNLIYVGRAIIWKINPVVKFLKDLKLFDLLDQFIITIVTDDIGFFKNELSEKIKGFDRLQINFFSNLNGKQLKDLMKTQHLNIGMGTAALEGARLGVPTIAIDASYKELPSNYKYRWIYETDTLALGRMLYPETKKYGGKMNFLNIWSQLNSNGQEISEKCHEYAKEHYDIENNAKKILDYRILATLKINELAQSGIGRMNKLYRKLNVK